MTEMEMPFDDLRAAYAELLRRADARFQALTAQLAAEAATDAENAAALERVKRDLSAVSELIDLLQSAVAVSIDRLG